MTPCPDLADLASWRFLSFEPGALAEIRDLALRQVAPAAHLEPLERQAAEADARELEQRVADPFAAALECARPRLGDDHLDPGVLLGRRDGLDRHGLHGPALPAPALEQPPEVLVRDLALQ